MSHLKHFLEHLFANFSISVFEKFLNFLQIFHCLPLLHQQFSLYLVLLTIYGFPLILWFRFYILSYKFYMGQKSKQWASFFLVARWQNPRLTPSCWFGGYPLSEDWSLRLMQIRLIGPDLPVELGYWKITIIFIVRIYFLDSI